MKRSVFAMLTLLAIINTLPAQKTTVYKPFRLYLAAGPVFTGGGLVSAEPSYNITDQLKAGVLFESANYGKDHGPGLIGRNRDFSGTSVLATFDVYFKSSSRFFAGAGAGIYKTDYHYGEYSPPNYSPRSTFGGMIRVGFETGHFRAAGEYNIVGTIQGANKNYLSVKFGFFVGGGRYKKVN